MRCNLQVRCTLLKSEIPGTSMLNALSPKVCHERWKTCRLPECQIVGLSTSFVMLAVVTDEFERLALPETGRSVSSGWRRCPSWRHLGSSSPWSTVSWKPQCLRCSRTSKGGGFRMCLPRGTARGITLYGRQLWRGLSKALRDRSGAVESGR